MLLNFKKKSDIKLQGGLFDRINVYFKLINDIV